MSGSVGKSRTGKASLRDEVEKRERIVRLVDEIEKSGGDPFVVNVREVLRSLRTGLESNNRELLLADSEAVESLSRLVKLQEAWVDSRLQSIVSPEKVKELVKSLSIDELSSALELSLNPSVASMSIDSKLLIEAARYWVSLKPRAEDQAGRAGETTAPGEPPELAEDNFQDELNEFRSLILSIVRERGRVKLDEITGLEPSREGRVRIMYLLSYLVSEGTLGVRYDIESDSYLIVEESGERGGSPVSVVLEVE